MRFPNSVFQVVLCISVFVLIAGCSSRNSRLVRRVPASQSLSIENTSFVMTRNYPPGSRAGATEGVRPIMKEFNKYNVYELGEWCNIIETSAGDHTYWFDYYDKTLKRTDHEYSKKVLHYEITTLPKKLYGVSAKAGYLHTFEFDPKKGIIVERPPVKIFYSSPDGKTKMYLTHDPSKENSLVWVVDNNGKIKKYYHPQSSGYHNQPCPRAYWNPQEETIAVKWNESSSVSYYIINGIEQKAYDGVNAGILFSPDGKHYVYEASNSDSRYVVFDGQEMGEYYSIRSNFQFSPDSVNFLFGAKIDKTTHAVILDGKIIYKAKLDRKWASIKPSMSKDGKKFVIYDEKKDKVIVFKITGKGAAEIIFEKSPDKYESCRQDSYGGEGRANDNGFTEDSKHIYWNFNEKWCFHGI